MRKYYSPKLFFLLLTIFSAAMSFAQGSTCATIEPFCAGDQALIFANCNYVDPNCSPFAEPGPDYGCLSSQPYPAWFYLQIDQGGRLDFQIVQNTSFDTNGNPTGTGLDVDFIAWGPFAQGDDLCDYTQLQSFNEIACSYSIQPVENFTIFNAQPGEIYVLVITNYDESPGFIKLVQTNAGDPGSGSTDCSILTTQIGCEGEQFTLDATTLGATNYLWEYDDGSGFVTIFNGNFPVINVTAAGDYRVTISFGVGTPQIREFEIITYPQPIIASPPLDMDICDDGTNPGIFDLTLNDPIVRGGQDPNYQITYHHSQLEAETNAGAITPANAYPIVGSSETIWVRIQEPSGTCYAIDSFEISFTSATATQPATPYFLCDQDADGQETINLQALFNATILNGQNPLQYTVTYHDNPADANTGNNPLPQPYTITVSPITIYARVENNNDPSCFATTDFEIILDLPPVVNTTPDALVVCDGDNDGFADFTLHDADVDITIGDPNLTVTYHYTPEDAQTNEHELIDPFQNIIPYNDRVYARIENLNGSCYAIVVLYLEVRDSPVLTEPSPYRICDDNRDGYEIFNLDSKRNEILNGLDPLLYDLYFYELEQDAIDAGIAALTAPDFSLAIQNTTAYQNQIPNMQTIYVLGVGTDTNTSPNNGARGCFDIVELQLYVDPLPTANEPSEYHLCDDTLNGSTPTDQISTFDLTTRNIEVSGGIPGLTVTWYETYSDEASDNPIPDPTAYQNITNAQTIIARLTNEFLCKDLATLTLVVDPLPTPAVPDPLELCDEGGGFAEFDLSLRSVQIINNETNVTLKYYPTEIEAEAGGPGEIMAPYLYTNVVPFNDSVWARLENNNTGCYDIVELQLIVIPLPDAPDANFMDPYLLCDLDGNGQAEFDLTVQDASVYGVQDPADFLPITYYTDLADAQAGTNWIDPANAFTSGGQPIWVRLESTVTGCVRITEFQLEVGAFPAHGTAEDLEACDDELNGSTNDDGISTFDLTVNTLPILNGDTTLTLYYYASQDDLDNDIRISNPSAYQNVVTPQQEIFVSVIGQNSCTDSLSFFITVNPNPVPVEPTPLYGCDVDNDGITQFDLDSKIAEIQGGDPSLIVSFHETHLDAVNNQYALTSPYQNIVLFNQTLYVRVAYDVPPADTGCYTVIEMELIVAPTPEVPQDLPDLMACDDSGFYEFNLRENESLIYGSQNPDDYTLTYHLTQADADAGTPFIAQPESFTNTTNPQTIWVRLTDNASQCYTLGSFDLIVSNGLPITDPEPWAKCDDLGEPFDGTTLFDLTSRNSEITNGVMTQGVLYFETEADAQNNENPIDPDTAYENTSNPQVLYVRVEDSNSGCIAYTTLTISVVANPNPVSPDPIELCDENVIIPPGPYDETELFDLTVRESQILNGNTWTVGYYESYQDAVDQNGEILPPDVTAYQNTSNPQTIYVRTTNPNSLCFEIVELQLIVNPLPDDSAPVSDYIICAPDDTEIGIFDLETKVPEILGDQTDPPFTVSFYLDQTDAENQTNAITNTTAHQNKDAGNNPINPQTIYVGILNTETNCYIGGGQSFDLMVQRGAVANTPVDPFVICDNVPPSDGYAEFDLDDVTNQQVSDLRAEILGGQDPAVYEITFHETLEAAEAGSPAISFPYMNIINPQRIYARVTNTANPFTPQCYAVAEVVLKVEQLPEIILDGDYRLCVDENGNPIAEEEGSMSPPIIDTGLDPLLYSFVWEYNGVIIPGENGPSIIALQGGEYTVTYTEIATNCEGTAIATVTVSSPPFTYEANLLTPAFSDNPIIEVIATGDGTYEYQLDNGPFQESNIFENVDPGNHLITIKDIYGCGSVTLEVGVIDYPPYFTPNNDGYHDTWNIIGIASGDPTAKIYIFDRFGKLLKQLSPLGTGWDGTYNGNPLPSSDYWFRVEYTEDGNAKEFKGHFTLKR